MRNLIIILGDQLNLDSLALEDFDPAQDAIWMAEVTEESTHVISSQQRTVLFLSAMRHFADLLRKKSWPLIYHKLEAYEEISILAGVLEKTIQQEKPKQLIMAAPGEWRVLKNLRDLAHRYQLHLDVRDDRHFISTVREFKLYAQDKKQLRMEFFYRAMRRKTGILMNADQPIGGQWNFDAENRESFSKTGPGELPSPCRFVPDQITQEVIRLVSQRFGSHPGSVESFTWPVSRPQALGALQTFIENRLLNFGRYQDAMWNGEVWLFHSHLSCALNLKLLDPREVITAAVNAYHAGHVPLASAEGFVRQILGWREYVRGIYWCNMPGYLENNAMQAHFNLPHFYWTGDTPMDCLHDSIKQTLAHGYAHHIQRLMVAGLYAQLLGVAPQQVHAWYLGVYVDAVEWVELPNTLGMSQFADGGLMSSKPYIASGKYIDRMSNYCKSCPFNPAESLGATACPFTTLYWNYLDRHAEKLARNPRLQMQIKNLQRLPATQRQAIAAQASQHRALVCPSG